MGAIVSTSTDKTLKESLPKELSKLIYYGFTNEELQELGLVDVYDEEKAFMLDNSYNILINH
jgi:hypothetical protein